MVGAEENCEPGGWSGCVFPVAERRSMARGLRWEPRGAGGRMRVERAAWAERRGSREDAMTETESLIAQVYSAFNRRDMDGALAFMSESVSWPRASEGGRAAGKEEIRAYWSRQWREFDPHVEPREVREREGRTHVRVHQVVKSAGGELLSDREVWHVYTISRGRIERMDLGEGGGNGEPASEAFSRR